MTRRTMLIVGGGLGGLSTGCYAQMNGYRSRVLEMHEIPGGSCTAWDRGDFTLDSCVSWLLGSGPGNEMHQIWLELGALQGKRMRNFDVFNTVRGRDGRAVHFYSDPDRLEAHLLALSPGDARVIRDFCAGLRTFRKALARYPFLTPVRLMGRLERWRMLASLVPYFNVIRRSIGTLMRDYSQRFQDPLLREAFNFILYEKHPNFPVLPFYFQLAAHADASAGVPEGGSLGLARSVEERYRGLGGEVIYNARVVEILVENDRAAGVRLSDGTELRADIVVSACDGRTTLLDLLKGRYLTDTYRELYTRTIAEPDMVFPGYLTVFLGLRRPSRTASPAPRTSWRTRSRNGSPASGTPASTCSSAAATTRSCRRRAPPWCTPRTSATSRRGGAEHRSSSSPGSAAARSCTRCRSGAGATTSGPSGRCGTRSWTSSTSGTPGCGTRSWCGTCPPRSPRSATPATTTARCSAGSRSWTAARPWSRRSSDTVRDCRGSRTSICPASGPPPAA